MVRACGRPKKDGAPLWVLLDGDKPKGFAVKLGASLGIPDVENSVVEATNSGHGHTLRRARHGLLDSWGHVLQEGISPCATRCGEQRRKRHGDGPVCLRVRLGGGSVGMF